MLFSCASRNYNLSMVRHILKVTCLNCGGDMDSIKQSDLSVKDMSAYECAQCGRTELVDASNLTPAKIAAHAPN